MASPRFLPALTGDRYLGVKIPPTNIQDYHLQTARMFANGLADRIGVGDPTADDPQSRRTVGEGA